MNKASYNDDAGGDAGPDMSDLGYSRVVLLRHAITNFNVEDRK